MSYPLFAGPSVLLLVASSLLGLSANNPLVVWFSLVLNLIAMVALFSASGAGSQSMMIYFLTQTLSSSMFLIPSIINAFHPSMGFNLVAFALFVKLGLTPFHFWVLPTILGVDWLMILILSTWQKLLPIVILGEVNGSKGLALFLSVMSVFVGGLGAMKASSVKVLFAFSSITHSGWLVTLSCYSCELSVFYLLVYFGALAPSTMILSALSPKLTSIEKSLNMKSNTQLMLSIASLSGLPPFSGFMMKLMVIFQMTKSLLETLLLFPLFVGSCLHLLAYLTLLLKVAVTVPHLKCLKLSVKGGFGSYLSNSFANLFTIMTLTFFPVVLMILSFF